MNRRRAATLLVAAMLLPAGATGALAPTALGAECIGDECEAPPPAPEDPTPGSAAVEAPGNPPVHYPTVRCPHGAHRVVHHGVSRCVTRKPPRHHQHRRRR